ncbi:MAG: hypothetical protein JWM56_141 [Candidatus Peribacteria bacterium]|nr:hypothetical protein [Candidatus Peribacteria bacterium]
MFADKPGTSDMDYETPHPDTEESEPKAVTKEALNGLRTDLQRDAKRAEEADRSEDQTVRLRKEAEETATSAEELSNAAADLEEEYQKTETPGQRKAA